MLMYKSFYNFDPIQFIVGEKDGQKLLIATWMANGIVTFSGPLSSVFVDPPHALSSLPRAEKFKVKIDVRFGKSHLRLKFRKFSREAGVYSGWLEVISFGFIPTISRNFQVNTTNLDRFAALLEP